MRSSDLTASVTPLRTLDVPPFTADRAVHRRPTMPGMATTRDNPLGAFLRDCRARIADALALSPPEREHLFLLAHGRPPEERNLLRLLFRDAGVQVTMPG